VPDPRVVSLKLNAQSAFDASKTVVIETTEVLDQAKKMLAGFDVEAGVDDVHRPHDPHITAFARRRGKIEQGAGSARHFPRERFQDEALDVVSHACTAGILDIKLAKGSNSRPTAIWWKLDIRASS